MESMTALAFLAGLFAAAALIKERRAALCAGLAMVTAVGSGIEILQRPGAPPSIDAGARETVVAEGCVVEPSAWFAGRGQFTIELAPGARARASIYPREGETPLELAYGTKVEFEGRFRPIRNYENAGSFDAAAYFARSDIYWNASSTGVGSVRPVSGRCGSLWRGWIFSLRGALLKRIDTLFGVSEKPAGTLRALLLGDATRLDETDAASYRRTGVYHVLVVSGLHLATIGTILLFLLRMLRIGVTASLIWTASIAWLYALLCGGTAPVVRAAAGLTLFALGRWFYRRPQVVNILAAVTIVYLVVDSGQLFEASFQLSFLAVALIGLLAAPLIERGLAPIGRALRHPENSNSDFGHGPCLAELRVEMRLLTAGIAGFTRTPQRLTLRILAWGGRSATWFAESAVVSVAIQAGMALPMVLYFHRLPLSSLTANLTVAPMMAAAVPIGLAALLTGWQPLVTAAAWIVTRSQQLVDWYAVADANLNQWIEFGSSGRIPGPPWWLAAAFAVVLGWLCAIVWGARRAWRIATLCFCVNLALLYLHPFRSNLAAGQLEVTAIDVGQGDSLLVVSPGGRTMLVDTGGIPQFRGSPPSRFDIAEDVVSPYLWSRSIRRLDVMAVTHPDADHAGGLAAILENFRPRELWLGVDLPEETLALARRWGVTIRRPRRGERHSWGLASLEILSPPDGDLGKENDRSLVLRASYGRHSFLLTGDIERSAERDLVDRELLQPVTVLKAAHHGSRTSSTPAFLDTVRPAIVLLSVGRENLYRHPNEEVLARLKEGNRQVLRTDEQGRITVLSDGRYLTVSSQVP
jgi:competence protein ComEC